MVNSGVRVLGVSRVAPAENNNAGGVQVKLSLLVKRLKDSLAAALALYLPLAGRLAYAASRGGLRGVLPRTRGCGPSRRRRGAGRSGVEGTGAGAGRAVGAAGRGRRFGRRRPGEDESAPRSGEKGWVGPWESADRV
ncbi:hypothetical protein PR202_ga15318 [Eleusine coracana subsp. coracana]|uniref:Uncharacterized protein n=1 Tax=Eleusine coracana subsp. coracana TaxID=191504 RepID=A0AAV5CJR3_ELECO|nr:hypothetical protein PR202_ga15318 [Eleusine coracana subsp. coracana]